MTKSIFNKGAFEIKAKVTDCIKYLDGGFNVTLEVKVWEMGKPEIRRYEIQRDCLGHIQVDSRV